MAVTGTSTTLGYASLDLGRRTSRLQDEVATAAAQVRAYERSGELLIPGSSVTTRIRYRVGRDGELIPTETRVTTVPKDESYDKAEGDRRGNGRRYFELQGDGAAATLAGLVQPKPLLSPADEVALYANAATGVQEGEAVAEDGTPIAVEIFTPQSDERTAQVLALASRAQASVASLYARNNDIVYNVTPYSELAA